MNGKPAAGIAIFQSPDANALAVATACAPGWRNWRKAFPQGLAWDIPFDTTRFVNASIDEVYKTLIEAGGAGADRHPGVPAGLARHAGAGDHRAGDDHRRLRRDGGDWASPSTCPRCSPSCWRSASWWTTRSWWWKARRITWSAACRRTTPRCSAMQELFGPIIGITLVLMSVFVPAAFLPGPDRADVCPVRHGHRRHGADQRDQRRDVEADAVRAVAAAAGAARSSATSCSAASTAPISRWSVATSALIGRMARHSGRMALLAL